MDFQEYVAARRTALVRAAVLLGVAHVAAPKIVRDVLLQEAGHIERRGDPDPVVLAALVLAARPESARLPEGDEPGLAVRRTLAGMDPPEREVAVLAFHADLTPHEEAAALELEVDAVVALEAMARHTLGVPDRLAARELMMVAADTVPPPPGDAIVRPARRARWPAVAAVAVAAVALTAAAVAASNDPEPVLDDDQVPSLFGYDADAARALLSERGLRVEQRRTRTCEVVETVVGSEPPTGARFEPGDTVTIWTAVPSDPFCMARYPARLDAWKFLHWAAGRGPAPEFADAVDVVVDDSDPVTLTGDQAVDRERWGDPGVLTLLSAALEEVYAVPGTTAYRTPRLDAQLTEPPLTNCGVSRPASTGAEQALSLSLSLQQAGPEDCPVTLDLYRFEGAIDTVVLYTEKDMP